ncbi:MAG: methyltransferase domain-containing protein [Phycisphaeraceae bacterium]
MQKLSACPICKSQALQQVYVGRTTRNPADPKRWTFARCSTCDHGFLNPQPQWDELGDYYHSGYQSYDVNHGLSEDLESTVRSARAAGIYRHVSVRPGLRILDVGSGGGSFLAVTKALGAQVRGVEPSPVAARRAREWELDVFEGSLEAYVASGNRDLFDLITFSHVVEHLPDPISTLALAATLLAQGGTIWVAVPNGACGAARRLQWRWHSSDLPVHLQHFSIPSMSLAAENAGLLIHNIQTYSLPAALRSSVLAEWRFRWKVPRRIGSALLSRRSVERRAARLDRDAAGEAILAQFQRTIEPTPTARPS